VGLRPKAGERMEEMYQSGVIKLSEGGVGWGEKETERRRGDKGSSLLKKLLGGYTLKLG